MKVEDHTNTANSCYDHLLQFQIEKTRKGSKACWKSQFAETIHTRVACMPTMCSSPANTALPRPLFVGPCLRTSHACDHAPYHSTLQRLACSPSRVSACLPAPSSSRGRHIAALLYPEAQDHPSMSRLDSSVGPACPYPRLCPGYKSQSHLPTNIFSPFQIHPHTTTTHQFAAPQSSPYVLPIW